MEVLSAIREDLGYIPKSKLPDIRKGLEASARNFARCDHRVKSFEILQTLEPELKDTGQTSIEIIVQGRKIEFWPSSDTYYLHAKREYGSGIEALVSKIHRYLSEATPK